MGRTAAIGGAHRRSSPGDILNGIFYELIESDIFITNKLFDSGLVVSVRYTTYMILRNFHAGRYSCALLLLTAACSSTPSTPSIAAPTPVSPATNLIVKYQDQPVTLTVQNAVATQPGGTTYTFEVATDLSFASKVQTKENVAEGNGQTSVRLTPAASRDYYWHVRAQSAGTTGVFGPTCKFTMGAAIVINSPVPSRP